MSLKLVTDKCLSDLSYSLSEMLGLPPICATAVAEHVFQSLVEHFYENSAMYLPNIGWIHRDGSEAIFTPCDAFEATLLKMDKALSSHESSFAGIETVLEAAERANSTDPIQDA